MSASKFRVNKICQYCSKPFEAQKVTTRFCSLNCNRSFNKQKARLENIASAEQLTIREAQKTHTPAYVLESLKYREFISVQQAGKILGCSKQTIYRLINSGRLKAVNLADKKTTIKRSDLDNLFA